MSGPNWHVENTIPVLGVRDLAASTRFYLSLGFKLDWQAGEIIVSVSRDRHPIMLQRRDEPAPAWVWIGCTSVPALWESIRGRDDVSIAQRPTNQPWALEMKIRDLDKNVLWFGSEPTEGVAFGDEPPGN